jgi:hypothetical protein
MVLHVLLFDGLVTKVGGIQELLNTRPKPLSMILHVLLFDALVATKVGGIGELLNIRPKPGSMVLRIYMFFYSSKRMHQCSSYISST